MPRAYYNELDKEKAAWLRELIKAGVIADGDVDERSILDVQPGDLAGYTQCHFFAGIGVWSYALRRAGIGDDERVWTGSCPCPSFSSAGKGQGFDDARHLWPDWARLIRERKPPRIFGEQADDAVGYGWLDLVQTDLEKADYAVGKAVLASASVGASDIRERLYWVAYAQCDRRFDRRRSGEECDLGSERNQASERGFVLGEASGLCATGGMGHAGREGFSQRERVGRVQPGTMGASTRQGSERTSGASGRLADTDGGESGERELQPVRQYGLLTQDGGVSGMGHAESQDGEISVRKRRQDEAVSKSRGNGGSVLHPFSDALKGFWRDADWLLCTDGKWRPVEAKPQPMADGTYLDLGRMRYQGITESEVREAIEEIGFPLGTGSAARLMRLRGYGDAINAELATEWIGCCEAALYEMRRTKNGD